MPSAHSQTTHALADSEPQALGEVSFARCAVVRWRRERSKHTWNGAQAEGGFLPSALCQTITALAKARRLRGLLQPP